ncbi:uncharacterized protein N7503_006800 [Penicillium pulvis]|uniref:uncharacterized protein n=1 Tax=Penicillium pulvis TaxID=1562058 RepID=UPI0025489739|nr:uncharacterized protein N7503_006800 [Penicillium pulvis]KAJ5797504.1 hypothetical protein N7503_006800 [Penicillium pulvis]
MTDQCQILLVPGPERVIHTPGILYQGKTDQITRHCTGTPDCMKACGVRRTLPDWQFQQLHTRKGSRPWLSRLLPYSYQVISWDEGGHTPTYMVTTNFEDNSVPTTLVHNRKLCPCANPTCLSHDVVMLTEVPQTPEIGKLDPDWRPDS